MLSILSRAGENSNKSLSARINDYYRSYISTLPQEERSVPRGANEVLARLDADFSSDIEIILSYGTVNTKKYFAFGTNPAGHIAIRIDGIVYTINPLVIKGEDKKIIFDSDLVSYLYGLEAPTKNVYHGDTYGNSFVQAAMSIRIQGVSHESKKNMIEYINQINSKFNEDFFEFKIANFNCSTYVFGALDAGGLIPKKLPLSLLKSKILPIKLPLDVFSLAAGIFSGSNNYKVKYVLYPQIESENQLITGNRFPMSFFRLGEAFKTILFPKQLHRLEKLADIKVTYDQKTKILSSSLENNKCLSHYY